MPSSFGSFEHGLSTRTFPIGRDADFGLVQLEPKIPIRENANNNFIDLPSLKNLLKVIHSGNFNM